MGCKVGFGESRDDDACEPLLSTVSLEFFNLMCPILRGSNLVCQDPGTNSLSIQSLFSLFLEALDHFVLQRILTSSFLSACSIKQSSGSAHLVVYTQAAPVPKVPNLLGL